MKKHLTLFVFILPFLLQAQNFTLVANDSSGDHLQTNSPDAKALYFAIEPNLDSIWFKFTFYGRIDNAEWNVRIALDTNNNPDDGAAWIGNNTDMHFDLMADVYNSPGFPPPLANVYNANDDYLHSHVSIHFPDSNTLILGFLKSDILQSNGTLNFIAGCGIIVGAVNDDIPNQGYLNFTTTDLQQSLVSNVRVQFYPNPTGENLRIAASVSLHDRTYQIYNLSGQIEMEGTIAENAEISVSDLSEGLYLIRLEGIEGSKLLLIQR